MEHIDISTKLKELLSRYSMNLKEFSEFVGVSRTSLTGYINGKVSPTIEPLVKICKRCDVSLDWLCSTEKNNKIHTVSDIILYFLNLQEIDQFSYKLTKNDNSVLFEITSLGSTTSNEVCKFIMEYLDTKEKLDSLQDKELAKNYYDMWLEKKLTYYSTLPVYTKSEKNRELYDKLIDSLVGNQGLSIDKEE